MSRRASAGEVQITPDGMRFELDVEGAVAFIDCRRAAGSGLAMIHTEVPHELSGQGVGTALVQGALDLARTRGMEVLPYCPFVHAYIRRHPEYVDLVSGKYPRRDDLVR